jgi:hypothetical protein
LRRAKTNSATALRYLDHRTLADVKRLHRPASRAVHRTRAGTRKRTYLPALRMLDRMTEPFTKESLALFADDHTTGQHDVVGACARALEARGHRLGPFHVNEGALLSGPLWYRHPRSSQDSRLHGILLGPVLVDVPDDPTDLAGAEARLRARGQGRSTVLVTGPDDIDDALDLAIGLGLDR